MDTSEDIGIDCIDVMQEIITEGVNNISFIVERGQGRRFRITIEEI